MRLHHLSVTAFGPFADRVEVDFDEVSLAGLFLIQGPTGAGKTSLLDAICFGLYAGVPGSRPGGRALRSDHAGRDVVPQVVVDFSTGTRRFRVTRSPEFLRPKRRGLGETRAPASVLLQEHHAGRWVVRSTRADEVGEIVTEVLGMGLEQFSKVVLLPQGEFAAFLRSTAEERRLLLERLFDISTWTGVEEWLVERRRQLAAEVAQARIVLDTDLARLGDVVATLPSEVIGDLPSLTDVPLERLPAAVAGIRARCDSHAGDALAALAAADLVATGAENARIQAEAIAERQRRGHAARADLEGLACAAHTHQERGRRAERAVRADALVGDLRALERAVAQARTAAAEVETARRPLSHLGIGDEGLPAVRGLPATLGERAVALTGARHALGDATTLRGEVAGRVAAAAGGRAELERLRHRESEADAAIRSAQSQVDEAQEAASAVTRLGHQVAALEDIHRTLLERDAAAVKAAALVDRARSARDTAQDARETYLVRRQARLDGMAAELASMLAAGEPCGVCGSLDHPSPAGGDLAVSSDEVTGAEETWLSCRSRLEELTAAVEAQRQLVRTREVDLTRRWSAFLGVGAAGSDLSRALPESRSVTEELDSGQQALAQASTVANRLAGAVERLTVGQQSLTAARTHTSAVAGQVVAHEAGLAEVRAQLVRRLGEVGAGVDDHLTCPCVVGAGVGVGAGTGVGVGTRVAVEADEAEFDGVGPGAWEKAERLAGILAGHLEVTDAVGQLVRVLEGADVARTALAAIGATVRAAIGEQGFTGTEDAAAALLPGGELATLRREIRAHDDRLAGAHAVLADDDVMMSLGLPDVDLPAVRAAGDATRQAQRIAQQVQTRAEQSSHRLAALAQSVVEQCRSLAPRLDVAARTAALADTATGIGQDNALRMRLSSFVLAARLEKVATLANERLGVMGDGRYELQHTDDLAAGGRRSGLGLVVRDLWTGQVRDTASLSGGESFMASLALALGLADAVREEAGGFDLRTLFIDEGFGTLDDESLEQVLAVLDALRDGGRAVGVVSHVSDLLTRIPTQICVTKSATGSSVRVRAC